MRTYTEAQKKAHAATGAKWQAAHPGAQSIYSARWYAANKEKACADSRAYHAANLERSRKNKRAWLAAHTDQAAKTASAWHAAHPGMTVVYATRYKVAKQESMAGRKKPKQCDVCKKSGRICFDHDHVTNNFRGWPCNTCNLALGHAKDSAKTLYKLADYVERPLMRHIVYAGGYLRKARQVIVGPRPTKCQVCKLVGRICADHCHKKNLFRGWLCSGCNSVLGYVNDSPKLLRKLATYLEAANAVKKAA